MRLAVLKTVKAVKGRGGSIPTSLRHIFTMSTEVQTMVERNNAAKAQQLGMPFGTATGRLRKSIMFKYVQLAGHDICFRCSKPIDNIDELSIEHKLPWQGRDTDLFWDLENIAFSHLRCNVPHEYRGGFEKGHTPTNKMVHPELLWCGYCKQFKEPVEFSNKKTRWSGKEDRCRQCRSTLRLGG